MKRSIAFGVGVIGAALALPVIVGMLSSQKTATVQGQGAVLPVFETDWRFPTMPDKILMGGVGGIAADKAGNVYVHHRPHTFEEGQVTENGWTMGPPVMVFDQTGKYLRGFGGYSKTKEYQWFTRSGQHRSRFAECPECGTVARTNGDGRPGGGEHGISVDYKGNVWLTGNGNGDSHVLKFSGEGKFLLQIGSANRKGAPMQGAGLGIRDSADTKNVSASTRAVVYQKTNEVFVSDGYGNRRVIVFDADTGAYKRLWGAYGNKPDDAAPREAIPEGPGHPQFNTPHGIAISEDGIVYVADRGNNRVQSFTLDGKFLKEGYNERKASGGTVYDVALSRDPQQRFIYIADSAHARIAIMDRNTLQVIGGIGGPGRNAGRFFRVHGLDTDGQGNIVTGESQGYRAQRFIYKGLSTGATN